LTGADLTGTFFTLKVLEEEGFEEGWLTGFDLTDVFAVRVFTAMVFRVKEMYEILYPQI
jgi:hypothetical protein